MQGTRNKMKRAQWLEGRDDADVSTRNPGKNRQKREREGDGASTGEPPSDPVKYPGPERRMMSGWQRAEGRNIVRETRDRERKRNEARNVSRVDKPRLRPGAAERAPRVCTRLCVCTWRVIC